MTMKTYLFPEVVGSDVDEWVPADVARELFDVLKSIHDSPVDINDEGSLVITLETGEDLKRAELAIRLACEDE